MLLSSDAGIGGGYTPSSSGSTSSSSRSAALSACSARARSASSTTTCGALDGGEFVEVESTFDGPGRELLDLGEKDMPREVALGIWTGGYISKGAEKDSRFTDSSISESLSSGIGIFVARSSDSSSVPAWP